MAWTSPKTWSTGDVLTAADMNTYVRDNLDAAFPLASGPSGTSWSPTVTGSTTDPGGESTSGTYIRIGDLVLANFVVDFGSTSGSGLIGMSVPVTIADPGVNGAVGQCILYDDSGGDRYPLTIMRNTPTAVVFVRANYDNAVNAYASLDGNPITVDSSDRLAGFLLYEGS